MPNRFWFRLTEVLPIAEHAVACPEHRLTAAQVVAGGPLLPALILTHSHGHEALATNGVPLWYDRRKDAEHAAEAHTWWHRANQRRGTDDKPQPPDRFLPLQAGHRDQHPPLITLLREGARQRMHWFVVNTDPTLIHRPERYEVRSDRDEIVPAHARWRPALVTATATARRQYPSLIADGYSIRGRDVLPRFDRSTVEQMIADLNAVHADTNPRTDPMPGEHAVLRMHRGTVIVLWEHDDGIRTRLVEIDRVKPDADGRYSVGAYLWPWTIAVK